MATDLRKEPEKAFFAELERRKIAIEAMIVRTQREWCAEIYIFRFEKKGKWSEPHFLPWNGDDTYAKILKVAK